MNYDDERAYRIVNTILTISGVLCFVIAAALIGCLIWINSKK